MMTKPLSNAQLEILQTFNFELSDEELVSFKQMLIDYFAEKISDDIDKVFEDNGWDDSVADNWAQEHMRTPYNPSN